MPMNWTSVEDIRLLLNILKIHDIKLDYAALATATGPDVTVLAIKKHIQKLRERAEKGDVKLAAPADSKTPKSTPKKASKTPTKATGTKISTSAAKSPAKKGTKRDANDDAKDSGELQEAVDDDEEGLKVEKMEVGKRIKLENGRFLADEGTEE